VTTYKVSIVVLGSEHAGAIINLDDMPAVGQRVTVGDVDVEVLEVVELLPPRGEFHFLHATCRLVGPTSTTPVESQ
jgi:hypothetical protein